MPASMLHRHALNHSDDRISLSTRRWRWALNCSTARGQVADNIKAVSAAITKAGREMTYSLSPGGQNAIPKVGKTPNWPRSCANFSL